MLLFCSVVAAQTDLEVAVKDRSQFPQADWWRYYYITTSHLEPEVKYWTNQSLRFVIASMTPRQQVLERSVPIVINKNVSRIDLLELGWDQKAFVRMMNKYPYHPLHNNIRIKGDWLLLNLVDQQEAENYMPLVYGEPPPKTRNEALARLNINTDIQYQVGLIEGASQVNLQGRRFVRNLVAPRGYAWGTFDGNDLTSEKDPLETPNGGMKHDGEEWIIGVHKTHAATGKWGALQVYFLANGQGQIVNRAPVDLVEDHTRLRGYAEIRTASSCMSCHEEGINDFTRNELKATIESGVQVLAQYKDAEFLERYHLGDLGKLVERDKEDFKTAVECICDDEPAVVLNHFRLALAAYDKSLTLEDGARLLNIRPEELRLMLGYYNAKGVSMGARIASWAHGGEVPRKSWEENVLTISDFCEQWKLLGGPSQ
jgi:hypothetical protein